MGDNGKQPAEQDEERPAVSTRKYNESSPNLTSPAVLLPFMAEESVMDTESRSRPTELQNAASHTPSPNRYEFALHGLLALGSRNGPGDDFNFSPVEESREHPVTSVLDSVDSSGSSMALASKKLVAKGIGDMQLRDGWQSTSPAQTQLGLSAYGRAATAESPAAPTPGSGVNAIKHALANVGTVGVDAHQTSISDLSMSAWTMTPDVVSADIALELLKHYRYQIAPWVSTEKSGVQKAC